MPAPTAAPPSVPVPGVKVPASAPSAEDAAAAAASASEANASTGTAAPSSAAAPAAAAAAPSSSTPAAQPDAPVGAKQAVWAALGVEDFDEAAATALKKALENAGVSAGDVDWLLLHQANIRIMEIVASKLGIPMERVLTNLSEYGNTSAAACAIALDESHRAGKFGPGDHIVLVAFGAGLTWASAAIRW